MFLGLDSSTQSLSALVIDPASGAIVREVSVNFGSALPAYHSPSGFISIPLSGMAASISSDRKTPVL